MIRRGAGLFFLCLSVLLFPSLTKAASADSVISANVPSFVSPSESTLVSDLSELPADGISSVLFTATIVSGSGSPLVDKDFTLSSNRGEVDTIRCYDGNTLLATNTTKTDAQGIARCIAYSLAPGQATFTGVADTITLDDKPTITFTPLPAISNITVTVELPGQKKITLIKPSEPIVTTPSLKTPPSENKLVNTQVELLIPFWVFILIILLLIASPFLFSLLVIIYRRLRFYIIADRQQREKEENLLAKIYELEQKLAQGQTVDLQQNVKISQQIAQTEQDIKQAVVEQTEPTNPANPAP